jgi:alkyl sulfatase BDS1-like metallo-beta-lactamase superfamily hydrolase
MHADFADRTDFGNANRGLVARLEPGVIKAADGRVAYDADAFTRTVAGDRPDTVDPSLWRQSQLTDQSDPAFAIVTPLAPQPGGQL